MNMHQWNLKYIKWLSAEEMNEATKKWLSELEFIRDEQHFFDNLLAKFPNEKVTYSYCYIRNLTVELGDLEKENELLLKVVISHKNKLEILLDGFNEIEQEQAYKEFHLELLEAISMFLIKHKEVKKDIFKISKSNLKDQKKKPLIISKS